MIHLTHRQRSILERMEREDIELTVYGLVVYIGLDRTNRQTLDFFLRNILVSSSDSDFHYFHINDCGKRLLKGEEKIYRRNDGVYVATIQELLS